MIKQWYVSKNAPEGGNGSEEQPFQNIQDAADLAEAGDQVLVFPGIYREWVRPRRGGEEGQPISYLAQGSGVVISGSEQVSGWKQESDSLWSVTLPDSYFGNFHSLRAAREGDWFHALKREHWLGELYVDGERVPDLGSRAEVLEQAHSWTRECGEGEVVLWLHLENEPECVEVGIRPACFYPEVNGLNYIRVQGFECCHAAVPWAPPTAEQMGMLGPRWSKGWVIEACHLHHVGGSALSLGLPPDFGDNEWSMDGRKHGSQRQREIVFRALNAGWSKEQIGSHLVRNCHIHDCAQAGIVGHLGAVFSTIEGNHIHDVFKERAFAGHEMAGIKIHAAIDTVIRHNRIHDCCRGIWLDWQAQGTRVTGNLFYANDWEDLYSEVNHGPLLVDHNLFLSPVAFSDCSQGLAVVHNLIAGQLMQAPIPNRFTPYHVPHSTEVAGVMTLQGGDARYMNNLFLSSPAPAEEGKEAVADENKDLKKTPRIKGPGTAVYDRYPGAQEEWRPLGGNVNDYASLRHPVHCGGNVYTGTARAHRCEEGAQEFPEWDPRLTWKEGLLSFTLPEILRVPKVNASELGSCIEAEMGFDDPDGELVDFGVDLAGESREGETLAGPWHALQSIYDLNGKGLGDC